MQTQLASQQLRYQVPHTQQLHVPVPTVLENDQRNLEGEDMTAQEIHDDCYAAMCQCPQFRGWDDDQCFAGYKHTFGDTPKQGLYKTILFWREWGDLLWEKGYCDALSPTTLEIFNNIDRVIADAIKTYCEKTQ